MLWSNQIILIEVLQHQNIHLVGTFSSNYLFREVLSDEMSHVMNDQLRLVKYIPWLKGLQYLPRYFSFHCFFISYLNGLFRKSYIHYVSTHKSHYDTYNNIKDGYSHKNPIKLLIIPIHRTYIQFVHISFLRL